MILVWTKFPTADGTNKSFYVAEMVAARLVTEHTAKARIQWDRRSGAYRATVDNPDGSASMLGLYTSYRHAMKIIGEWVNR